MKRLVALLALWLSACPQPINTNNPALDPNPNSTTTAPAEKPETNDETAPSDSVVLNTLKVSPTPGLEKKGGYRERGGMGGVSGGFAADAAGVPGGYAREESAAPIAAAPAEPMPVPAPTKRAPAGMSVGGGGEGAPGYITPAKTSLTAGEIDDNEKFTDYLEYLKKDLGGPAHKIDVSQRIRLKIVDDEGRPVHDAKVTLLVDGVPRLVARSHSDGGVVLFPHAAGTLPSGKVVKVKVEKKGVSLEREIDGLATEEKVVLKGAPEADKQARLDLVFCIDTTGSMGDEIAQIQATIQDIISKTASLPAKPEIRLGMVLYGDRGDVYVTRAYDFTTDHEAFKKSVATIQMTGGGDIPEDVNSGLEDAVESLEWENREAVRLVFLIGDAAPHMDYGQQYDYKVAMLRAAEQGIKIFPLASSGLEEVGEYVFRQLALFTEGRFLFLTYGAGGTTSMNVDRQDYTPDKLDDLVIKIIADELAPLAK